MIIQYHYNIIDVAKTCVARAPSYLPEVLLGGQKRQGKTLTQTFQGSTTPPQNRHVVRAPGKYALSLGLVKPNCHNIAACSAKASSAQVLALMLTSRVGTKVIIIYNIIKKVYNMCI